MANDIIASRRATLAQKLSGAGHTVADLLAQLPAAEKNNTIKSHRTQDRCIRDAIGKVFCQHLTTKHCAEVLETLLKEGKARMAQAVRSRMIAACQRGCELGWLNDNPAERTGRPEAEVKRSRLSLEQFQAIYAVAPQVADWLQAAMMLALVSGQDRSTVASMKRSQVTQLDGERVIVVQRSKTADTNDPIAIPLRLRLEVVGVTLGELLAEHTMLRSQHYVHHCKTYGLTKAGSSVHPDRISHTFTEARKLAGLPDEIDGRDAPTFHEIRSLSKRLYDAQGGVDTKALLGHETDEAAALYAKSRGTEIRRVRLG